MKPLTSSWKNDASGAQTEKHQKRMMGEIAKLTAGSNGFAGRSRLQAHGSDLAFGGLRSRHHKGTKRAWTSMITDKALK